MSKNLNIWIEGTIIAALATVLSLIPFNIGPSFSVTVGAPVMILYCLAPRSGSRFLRQFSCGVVLHILIGTAYILTPLQGFIEYFIAFGFTGLAGLFTPKVQQATADQNKKALVWQVILGTIVGTVGRYFWHTIAGYYFWGSYAPEGWSAWFYSITLNGASALATGAFTIMVLAVIAKTNPQLFVPKKIRARVLIDY